MVVFSTTLGEVTIELYPEKAPITVENFLAYVDAGFYDGTVFHRVVPGFVIQGGGFTESMEQKSTRPPIKNEADNGLKNERGTLSMARTRDVNSGTSQFFINLIDNAFLDHGTRDFGYAVFARVVVGMDVIDKIGPGGHFLEHDHTFERFKEEIWRPKLMNRQNWEDWTNAGSQRYGERVHARVLEILETETEPLLDEKMFQELHRVCELADARHKDEELDVKMFA